MPYSPEPLPPRARAADPGAALSDLYAQMRTRRTVRDFSDRPVRQDAIERAIAIAGTAPSGANHQPWHFVAIKDANLKARIRAAAEEEERAFYDGAAGDAWLDALAPIGTDASKPHLTDAPWLVVVFAQRYGVDADGTRFKHYYVPESTGIACGFLISALHQAGLDCLTHTPAPMGFLREVCARPEHEKPIMILAVGYAAAAAQVPKHAGVKKPLSEILTIR